MQRTFPMLSRTILALLSLVFLVACAPTAKDAGLKDAIKEHPEIVLDALGERKAELFALVMEGQHDFQDGQRQARQDAEFKKPLSPAIDPARAMRGPADAATTVVVYSDFLCPYCARGAVTLGEFAARHPDSVRIVFKHYATDELAKQAALVYEALAIQDPKMAFAFHDAAFAAQNEIEQGGEPVLYALAIKLGANVSQLKRDLKRADLAKRIDDDTAEARSFGFDATPTFVINGVSVRGAAPLDEFEDVLRRVSRPGGQEAPCAACDKKNS
ncbi:DsbA family protein [Desulfovibrio sp. TomC]|uniref:DsbA family protein n=1 Tax=Desulfovibrio sp. TomC TaxID=1562888 RepID=UPI001E4568DF|nr:thioredoxin domain-containing protein [Desulfovibrio sp. TomC]